MEEKDAFIAYLEYEKKYSYYTFKSYDDILTSFINYLTKENKSVLQVTYKDFNNYLKKIDKQKSYKANSISKYISTFKSFYRYLYEVGKIDNNPALLLATPKKERLLPKYLYDEQIEMLLDSIDIQSTNGLLTKLIIELLYSCGLRVSELVAIKLTDINFEEKKIKVTGKGSKERYVLYGTKCQDLLDAYLKKRGFDNGYLLLKNKQMRLRTEDVRKYINYFALKSGLKTHVYPHMLRHTFATDMLNNGASLSTVKELLGHENLSTTSIYTHVSNERLRNVYLKTHPRVNKKD